MEKEFRSVDIELRAKPESRIIEGRAIPFNIQSPNREGFRETISPSAVEGVIEQSDIYFLYNHDSSKGWLARSKKGKGSLCIEPREDGLYFSFELGSDNLSTFIYERIEKGDLSEMSWAFTVAEETWTKAEDGVYDRNITKFDRLYDFSVVDNSYYGIENAVGCKRFAEIQEEERLANERAMKEAEERAEAEKQAKLDEYYKQLVEEFKQYIPEK